MNCLCGNFCLIKIQTRSRERASHLTPVDVDEDDDDGCEGVKMREGPAVAATEVSVGSRPLTWAHLG